MTFQGGDQIKILGNFEVLETLSRFGYDSKSLTLNRASTRRRAPTSCKLQGGPRAVVINGVKELLYSISIGSIGL